MRRSNPGNIMLRAPLLSLLMLMTFPLSALGALNPVVSIVGTYICNGHDPLLNIEYKGKVEIAKNGGVYILKLAYNTGEKSTGTGIFDGRTLSLVYQDMHKQTQNPEEDSPPGLQIYVLSKDGKSLQGEWVNLGKTQVGYETCTKQ